MADNQESLSQPQVAEKEPQSELHGEHPEGSPDDVEGFKVWLYVLAGFVTYVNVSGALNSFGVYQAYYQSHKLSQLPASSISWIGSTQTFLAMGFGIFVGPLYDRGFLRALVAGGSLMIVLGMMMTSIAHSYYQILLAQGFCVGFGMGLVYVPVLGEVSCRFAKRRPIALGLSSTGACAGGAIYPVLIRRLIHHIGFGGTIRVVATINAGCGVIAFAIVCRRPSQAKSSRKALDVTAFREMPFTLFTIGMFLVFVPYYVPLTYIPVFAQTTLGASEDLAGYLLAIINATSLLGRTVPYVLNSRITPIRIFFFWILAGALMLFAWIGVANITGIFAWCVCWGIVSGALATAPIAAVSHPVLTPSSDQLGTRLGMSLLASAVGDLVGPPIMGALAGASGLHYVCAQAVSGAIMTLGGVCLLWPLRVINKYTL